jgi:hypothetical protein
MEPLKRTCSKCGETYPLTVEYFQRNSTNRDNTLQYYRPECKSCNSQITRQRREARKLVGNPPTPKLGTPCQLCGRQDQELKFDHCHQTLRHRGWICNSCNKGLGLLGDTLESLERVVRYLGLPA